jgi:hypothetical protein
VFRLSLPARLASGGQERAEATTSIDVVPADPARFENLVACHLLKWVHYQQDAFGRDLELRYFRDTDGREVDFVVVEGRTPTLFVECKWSDAIAALPENAVSQGRRVAGLRDWHEGLRHTRRDPRGAGPTPLVGPGLATPGAPS